MTYKRTLTTILGTATLATGLTLAAPAYGGHGGHGGHESDSSSPQSRIPLPNGFRPEGIATGSSHTAYLGSLADGDIYAPRPAQRPRPGDQPGPGYAVGRAEAGPRPAVRLRRRRPATRGSSTCAAAGAGHATPSCQPGPRRSSTT